ncbi:hypothetical protein M1397_03930 [Candidatus Marsarchaeota archaeon]|jgi:hypothetical protein|nr:hypothetical protein [Candidatus Marsarchaeota archaeon]
MAGKKRAGDAKAERREERCIICNSVREGLPIKVDGVVTALRWLNSHTIKHKNPYAPVVCKECFVKYSKARKSYERKRISYLIIGFLFAILLIVGSHGTDPIAYLFGLAVIVFMYLLSLISYMPKLDIPEADLEALQRAASQKKPKA